MKKKIFLSIIAVAIVCIGIYLSFVQVETSCRYEKEYSEENMVPLYELTDAASIQEKVQVEAGSYTGIGFKFGTYGQVAEGNINVTIKECASGSVVASGRMDVSKAVDGGVCPIEFEQEFQVNEGKEYELTVTGEGLVSGKTVTLFVYDGAQDSELIMNQEVLQDKELIVNFYQDAFDFRRCMYLICSLIVLELYVAYVMRVVTEEI